MSQRTIAKIQSLYQELDKEEQELCLKGLQFLKHDCVRGSVGYPNENKCIFCDAEMAPVGAEKEDQ